MNAPSTDWQHQHTDLTARRVAIETAIDDRVYHLFNLTPTDRDWKRFNRT